MKKGLKKFTVPYSGYYFDGGRIFGQKVVFAVDSKSAEEKVQLSFFDDDEPIISVLSSYKWCFGDKSDSEICLFWNM